MCNECGCGQPEEKKEEAPVEATEVTPTEESKEETPTCGCSIEETKRAEDLIRDLINLVCVYKEEEKQDVTTKIDPDTAEELNAKLEELAKKVGDVCKCE